MSGGRGRVVAHVSSCGGHKSGPGAWAAVLTYGDSVRSIGGVVDGYTTNALSVIAVIQAMRAMKRPVEVEVRSPSHYFTHTEPNLDTLSRYNWRRKDMATGETTDVPNKELWQELMVVVRQGGHRLSCKYMGPGADKSHRDAEAEALAKRLLAEAKAARASTGRPPEPDDTPQADLFAPGPR